MHFTKTIRTAIITLSCLLLTFFFTKPALASASNQGSHEVSDLVSPTVYTPINDPGGPDTVWKTAWFGSDSPSIYQTTYKGGHRYGGWINKTGATRWIFPGGEPGIIQFEYAGLLGRLN